MEQKHILIVDDDQEIRELLEQYLQKNQYQTTTLPDGLKLEETIARNQIDLVILDVMMPGEDGYSLCRKLRSQSNIPIIMLTACGEDVDRIVGLEMGADDYLPKPFNPRELLARMKAVFRRLDVANSTVSNTPVGNATMNNTTVNNSIVETLPIGRYSFQGWKLESKNRQLIDPQGVVAPLSNADYRLLKVFLDHPNRILNRDQLLDYTQGREADPFDRAIDVQVSRLRQRLHDNAKKPSLIKTIRGEGYLFATEVEVEQ